MQKQRYEGYRAADGRAYFRRPLRRGYSRLGLEGEEIQVRQANGFSLTTLHTTATGSHDQNAITDPRIRLHSGKVDGGDNYMYARI